MMTIMCTSRGNKEGGIECESHLNDCVHHIKESTVAGSSLGRLLVVERERENEGSV